MGSPVPPRPRSDTGPLTHPLTCGQGLRKALERLEANRAAYLEERDAIGGACIAAAKTALPVLRGATNAEDIPGHWRERFEALAAVFDAAVTGKR